MTTDEKDLLVRALGTDEPPLRLDLDALETRARTRVRTRALIGVVIAVATISAAALAVNGHEAVDSAGPAERAVGYCYRTADIGSTAPNQHVMIGLGDRDGRVDVTGEIVRICGDSWQSNVYDFQPRRPGATSYPVPPLVACVLTAKAVDAGVGAVGVFPGTASTCAELGLQGARQ
ncbi:hypothetical protein [Amycolatopsis sp. NPDC004378]